MYSSGSKGCQCALHSLAYPHSQASCSVVVARSRIRILYALLTRVWETERAKAAERTNAREQLEHVKLTSSRRGFPDYQETFSNRLTAEVRSVAASKSGRETFISSIGFHLHDLPEISTWYILRYLTFA